MNLVTFIIPSINRTTLADSLASLMGQTDQDWKAVVVFDGIEAPAPIDTDKIKYVFAPKQGHAGLVRNIGFQHVETPWIAFLDDDDIVASTYVEELKKHVETNDVVIFTMVVNSNGDVHPNPGATTFQICDVGISFAVRKEFRDRKNISFNLGEIEDYYFLDACRRAGARYILTHSTQYFASARNWWRHF